MIITLILILIILPSAYGSICTGIAASPNWYGSVGYPPYFNRSTIENCPQKYSLSRCEQSAVMKDGSSNFTVDDYGAEVCTPPVDCSPTKQNCNDTLVCSDLIQLKDELMEGGHNIVCRHEKTFWSQYTGEVKNCHINNNCLDSEVKVTQRQLQPLGWESAKSFATSFSEMDIPIGKTYSSPLARCAEHAQVFSDEPNEEVLELLYMSIWEEVLELYNITEIEKVNGLKWQAYNLRNFAGKKPSPGKNNIMITHGYNIKLAFGTAVDEGYCMVLKPEDSEPSLADSIGNLQVGNRLFYFDNNSFPVDAIARMSPESALLMQTCDDVRSDAIENDDDLLARIDTDHDMKITKEEFISAHDMTLNQAYDAYDFILSVAIQPELLGKPVDDESRSIELGQFFHINWGWREYLKTGGDISYPWRSILENTIGPLGNNSPASRVAAFKQANYILSNLIIALRDDVKYPSKAIMEERLINCDISDTDSQNITNCSAQVFQSESGGSAYIPIGPADGGAAALRGESIFGTPLAYPSQWKPDFYDSRLLKVAKCLVGDSFIHLSDMLESMGCIGSTTTAPTPAPSYLHSTSPTEIACSGENQRSKSCGGHFGEDECCPGLVCHYYQSWRCVTQENKFCATEGAMARKCGARWKAAPRKCCDDFVCDFKVKRCKLRDDRRRWHEDGSQDDIYTTTDSPTFLDFTK